MPDRPERPSKLQRWLDVVAYLASRRLPVTTEELWRKVPAYAASLEDGEARKGSPAERMFERDKRELRALGIPIETVTFSINYGTEQSHGYRLARRDFHLPYLRLVSRARQEEAPATGPLRPAGTAGSPSGGHFVVEEAEAAAALQGLKEVAALPAFPLSAAARSAFRKLAFDLEPEILREAPVHYVEDDEARASTESLRHLSDALVRRKRVSFGYHSMHRDERSDRTVEPYGLVFQHGRWYVVARDPAKDPEPRMFRVGRMTEVTVNAARPATPDYAIPDDFDLQTFEGRSAWELGQDAEGPIRARVRFRFPRSVWAERNGMGVLESELSDGGQIRVFDVRRRDPFLRWVLSLGGDARVEGPADLRTEFERTVGALRAKYGGHGVDEGTGEDA